MASKIEKAINDVDCFLASEDGGYVTGRIAVPGLSHAQRLCHRVAKKCGWWPEDGGDRNVGELLALVHSEISEALEGFRKNRQDDHLGHRQNAEVELADAVIRIMDMAEALDFDIGGAVIEKLAYNIGRDDHKPENRAKEGGKKF